MTGRCSSSLPVVTGLSTRMSLVIYIFFPNYTLYMNYCFQYIFECLLCSIFLLWQTELNHRESSYLPIYTQATKCQNMRFQPGKKEKKAHWFRQKVKVILMRDACMLLGNMKLLFIYIKSVNTFTYGFLSPGSWSLKCQWL